MMVYTHDIIFCVECKIRLGSVFGLNPNPIQTFSVLVQFVRFDFGFLLDLVFFGSMWISYVRSVDFRIGHNTPNILFVIV